MQHGRVQIVQVHGIVHRPETELIGRADNFTSLDPAAGHPDREAVWVMVAPVRSARPAVRRRAAAEFAAPDHESGVEQATGFQVRKQTGYRLVGLGRSRLMVSRVASRSVTSTNVVSTPSRRICPFSSAQVCPYRSREATILRMRFGLDDNEPRTLKEIGESLGLTRERVRQIETEALARLAAALEG